MAYHEFGILSTHEEQRHAYFEYTPEKFSCIRVDMSLIDSCGLFLELQDLPTYFQRISWPAYGFDEAGITLIPPDSLPRLRAAAAPTRAYGTYSSGGTGRTDALLCDSFRHIK